MVNKECNSNVARPVHGGMHAHAIPSLLPHPEGKVVRGGNQGERFNNEEKYGILHCLLLFYFCTNVS